MSVLFADIKTPYIDTLTTRRVLSPAVKENIFQGLFTKPDEAVTEQFSEDTDASEIQVLRVKPSENNAREIGSEKNGDWFNSEEPVKSSTAAYGIQILQTIDRQIDIPTNAQDMVSVDLLEAETKNLTGLINRNINAATIAAQLAKNFNNIAGVDKKNSTSAAEIITAVEKNWVTVSNGKFTDAFIDAAAKLDEGNSDEGIDAYPTDMRCCIVRPTAKAATIKAMTALYGGVGVFDVLKNGGVDRETKPAVATTGYIGNFLDMNFYCGSAVVFKLVEKYLGLSAGALDDLAGIMVSGAGTGRALAFNSKIKDIPCPKGQGIRLQPKYRFGVECWDALSVVPIFSKAFTNPVSGADNDKLKAAALYVRGIGSRAS